MHIILASLGAGDETGLSLGALHAITTHHTVFATLQNDCAAWLCKNHDFSYESLDDIYESAQDFDELTENAVARLLTRAKEKGTLVYAAAGGLGDGLLCALFAEGQAQGATFSVETGAGYGELAALLSGGADRAILCPAASFAPECINPRLTLVITEVDNPMLAAEIKLMLCERYDDETPVHVVFGKTCQQMPLYAIDQLEKYSHLCAIVLPRLDIMALKRYDFTGLCEIVAILRGQNESFPGCPWDMEQTHKTLRGDLVEEAYEVLAAMEDDDPFTLADELGDLLLQVVLHTQIAQEFDEFTMTDVATAICQKMIHRHPHIFADGGAKTADQVLAAWDGLKRGEKGLATVTDSMHEVPRDLPALVRVQKMAKRASRAGEKAPERDALVKALSEKAKALRAGDETACGDFLWLCALLVMACGCDGELALENAISRFIERFSKLEAAPTQAQKDALWGN